MISLHMYPNGAPKPAFLFSLRKYTLAPVAIANWRPGMAWSAKPGMLGGAVSACMRKQNMSTAMMGSSYLHRIGDSRAASSDYSPHFHTPVLPMKEYRIVTDCDWCEVLAAKK